MMTCALPAIVFRLMANPAQSMVATVIIRLHLTEARTIASFLADLPLLM